MPERSVTEAWRHALCVGPPGVRWVYRALAALPGSPRCRSCAAPFAGAGALVARPLGLRPWDRNPEFCEGCIKGLTKRGVGGAEIELSMLFSDVRGSTPMAERMSPTEFAATLERFYRAATDVLVRHEAWVDSFVGDEVIGMFVPALAGPDHAGRAVDAARALLRATGYDDGEPWIPIGTGVHTGIAYVGAVGTEGQVMDIKALGDSVNTTARLASSAGEGEVLVSTATADAAGIDTSTLERRELELKGKAAPFEAFVISAARRRRDLAA